VALTDSSYFTHYFNLLIMSSILISRAITLYPLIQRIFTGHNKDRILDDIGGVIPDPLQIFCDKHRDMRALGRQPAMVRVAAYW